jgi:hypothetical protein
VKRFLAGLTLMLALAALVAASPALAQPGAASPPPPLDVLLTPHMANGEVDRLDVRMKIAAPEVGAGSALLRMPVILVSTPTAAYEASAIQATDDRGALRLTAEEEPATPSGVYRRYLTDRATVGDVTVRYGAPPRDVSIATRNGPLFDLRRQTGGVMGAGVYFFALPDKETPYSISLDWDLTAMPAGARGVWSVGEGRQTIIAPAEVLAFSFYAAGTVKSVPEAGGEAFALYWLDQPPFDTRVLAGELRTLYDFMSNFFGDAGAPYRVFIRGNPYPAGGGTSLARSFMFGYGAGGETTTKSLQQLLAHEMAHNWPRLNGDEDHALTAWYTEGTAEYYSALLSLRAGVLTPDAFLRVLNEGAEGYYTNPYLTLTNAEAGAKFWQDSRAQKVPYGRGFMYLAKVDAQVKAATGGRRGLNDLVLEVQARQRRDETVGAAEWVEMLGREIGAVEARAGFDAMVSGEIIVPAANSFGPCFRPVATTFIPFELGFDEMSLGVVSKLREGSAAAEAGLKDGDVIVSMTPLNTVRDDEARTLNLEVRRDGVEIGISYLPRGAPVPGWRWERSPGASDAECVL